MKRQHAHTCLLLAATLMTAAGCTAGKVKDPRDLQSPSSTIDGGDADARAGGPSGTDAEPTGATDAAPDRSDGGPNDDAGPVDPAGPRAAWPMGTRYIMSGHSLTDAVISNPHPGRIVEVIEQDPDGAFNNVAKATIAGSPIHWRWNHREEGGDQEAQWPEDMPDWQGLVITTAVPLYADDRDRQVDTVDWLKRAVDDAWARGNGGRGVPTLLFTTWPHVRPEPEEPHPEDGLTFRERLNRDEPRWHQMQDFVNASRPTGQVPLYLIPGHRFMMRVWDDIQAGRAPFSNIGDIFFDNIHVNDKGQYAMTLLHYAVIYGRDPASYLPDRIVDEDTVTAAEARYFKRIVAEIVTSYERTGLTRLATR